MIQTLLILCFLGDQTNNQTPNLCSDSKIHSKIVYNATQSHENRSKRQKSIIYTPKQNIAVKRLYLRSTAMDIRKFCQIFVEKTYKKWYNDKRAVVLTIPPPEYEVVLQATLIPID